MAAKIALRQLPGDYVVCKLGPKSPLPKWAEGEGFVSITRTIQALSIVCASERIPQPPPAEMQVARGWRCFEFVGPFAFDETGVALAVIRPLSENDIGVFLVATFDTDYLLIQAKDVDKAKTALLVAGHTFV
jgi:uncharacterized protein